MKTLTTVLIILFLLAALLFGSILAKSIFGFLAGEDEVSVTDVQETVEENEQSEDLPGDEEIEVEEVPDQDSGEIDPLKIEKIEIYLDGNRDDGIFLGEAKYGLTSKEAYRIYGEDFSQSGFLLASNNTGHFFEPGSIHYLYTYSFIPEYGWEHIREKVTVSGTPDHSETIELHIDGPGHEAIIEESEKSSLRIGGWSADLSASDGTGIDRVEIYLNGPKDFGKFLGKAEYGIERQDVVNVLGNANYINSGYSLTFNASGLESGTENSIYIYSYSTSGTYKLGIRDIIMEGEKGWSNAILSLEAKLSGNSIEINGWAVSKDSIQNIGPRNPDIEYISKKIIFVSNKNGNEDIYSINLDGSELTQLTDYAGKDAYPAPSPDGKKIAYTSDIKGYWQIMTMNRDGTDKVQITDDPARSGYPTWSFDGRYIFYEVRKDGDWEIYRVNSDGSNRKRLTFNAGSYDWHPFAHPFEYKVIYESGVGGHEDIFIMDHDGKNIEKISESDARKRVPSMSIDGELIAFMGEGDTRSIYLMDADGENIQKVTERPDSEHPFISPDNQYIAFNSLVDGQREIFIINIDGTGETRLTSIAGDDWGPAFMYQVP